MKKKTILTISAIALAIGLVGTLALNINTNISKATDECAYHNGYHYLAKDPTFDESGHKEFWSCCVCHHSYIDEAPNGSFIDQDDSLMTGTMTDEHIAYLPQLQKAFGKVVNDGRTGKSFEKHLASLDIYEGTLTKGDSVFFYTSSEEPIEITIEQTLSGNTEVEYIDSNTSFPFIVFTNCPSLSTLANTVYFTNYKDENTTDSVLCRYWYRDYSEKIGNYVEEITNMSAYCSNDVYDSIGELVFKTDLAIDGGAMFDSAYYCVLFFKGEFNYPLCLLEYFRYLYLDGICIYLIPSSEITPFTYTPGISSKTKGCLVREHYFSTPSEIDYVDINYKTLDLATPMESEPYFDKNIKFLQDASEIQMNKIDASNECIIKSDSIYLVHGIDYSNNVSENSLINSSAIVLDEEGNVIGKTTITSCDIIDKQYCTTIGYIFDKDNQRIVSYPTIGAIYFTK